MQNIAAVDLFCGVGGLTYGLQKAGINVIAGIDIEESCRFPYEANNDSKFIQKDIKTLSPKEVNDLYPENTDIKILAGCAPCQPFSSYSYRYKGTDNTINKMDLLDYFGIIVNYIKPDIVSMENVPQLAKEDVFKKFLKTLELNDYSIEWKIVYAPEYGVPQNRKRLVLLASKKGTINLIEPLYTKDNYPTVRTAISSLPVINAGETHISDNLHRSAKLNKINQERIKQSLPGGTWKDWDYNLLLECHKKETGSTYRSVYGRMEWDKPSPTITTQFYGFGNGRFGHPQQDRAISLREGAMLQTFPQNYQFIKSKDGLVNMRVLATAIGNAVPVKLGEAIGKSIIDFLGKE